MKINEIKAQSIGHLGLVAATMQEAGIMAKVDQQLGMVEQGLNYGYRVGAMLLNGLGFINTALYMTPRFFYDKPIDLLLGGNVNADQLNDDSLGRCLDKIAAYGPTKWYSEIALEVVLNAGLLSRTARIDSTSLSLFGEYTLNDKSVSPKPLLGYSKDHRPDLKQVTLQCVSLGKSALPIWMEALDGNSSDKKSFPETVKRVDAFYKKIKQAPNMCFIGDSALYNKELNELNVDWLTRVPEAFLEAKNLCNKSNIIWQETKDPRYKTYTYKPINKNERWLLIRSEPLFKNECVTFINRHEKHYEVLKKLLWHASCQPFLCEEDAKKTIDKIIKKKKHFYQVNYEVIKESCFSKNGRPKKDQKPDSFIYQVEITGIASDLERIKIAKENLGRFILATNILDENVLSNEEMLIDYKEQGEIERGFRFIKNDTLGLDEVYLKKTTRIGALMAIMTLCLLVYGLAQYRLRDALKKQDEVLPNQKKKPIKTPTMMWIFSLFSSIVMLVLPKNGHDNRRVVLNLQPLHQKVILLFGAVAKKIYLLPDNLQLQDVVLNQNTWLKWCGI